LDANDFRGISVRPDALLPAGTILWAARASNGADVAVRLDRRRDGQWFTIYDTDNRPTHAAVSPDVFEELKSLPVPVMEEVSGDTA